MRTSEFGKDFIKSFESLHDGDLTMIGLQPKMDPRGIWTEGWGRAMRDDNGEFLIGNENRMRAIERATIHTAADADAALDIDLKAFELIVSRKLKVSVSQRQFDMLVSHVYNTGGSDTLFNRINRKESEARIRQWWETTYVSSGGRKYAGLIRRRKSEADIFFDK